MRIVLGGTSEGGKNCEQRFFGPNLGKNKDCHARVWIAATHAIHQIPWPAAPKHQNFSCYTLPTNPPPFVHHDKITTRPGRLVFLCFSRCILLFFLQTKHLGDTERHLSSPWPRHRQSFFHSRSTASRRQVRSTRRWKRTTTSAGAQRPAGTSRP